MYAQSNTHRASYTKAFGSDVQSVESPTKTYPGICNLCTSQFHINDNCQLKPTTHVKTVGPDVQSVQSPTKTYPGICNLCSSQYHITANCQFSLILYHATNRSALNSILENGFIPRPGRLGKAVYASDDQLMCIKFIYQNRHKFNDPILLKLKVYATEFKQLKHPEQIKSMQLKQFKQKNIQYIKCPYYTTKSNQKTKQKTLYQFALYKVNYAVVAYSPIKFPDLKIQTKNISVALKNDMDIEKQSETLPELISKKSSTSQKSTQQSQDDEQRKIGKTKKIKKEQKNNKITK